MERVMNVLAVSKRDRKRRLAARTKGVRYTLSVARSPGELTSSFRAARPDVVVVDRQLPHRTGRALIERLLDEDPSVPILIVEDIDSVKPDTLAHVAGLSGRASPSRRDPGEQDLAGHTLPELHHATSARGDARRVQEEGALRSAPALRPRSAGSVRIAASRCSSASLQTAHA